MFITEFPHTCVFKRIELSGGFYAEETEVETYSGVCDIQHTSSGIGNIAEKSTYTISIPIPSGNGGFSLQVRKGDRFEGIEYGIARVGTVLDVSCSMLGKASVFVESDNV